MPVWEHVHCVVKDWPTDRYDRERYCCILSVGSALPRRLPQSPTDERLLLYYNDPVSYRETLHWLPGHSEGTTGKMLAFDTVSEMFRLMPRPPQGPEEAMISDLLELDGELSVVTIYSNGNGTMLDIWALQDYEAEKWTLRHRLKVQPPREGPLSWPWAMHPVGEGAALSSSDSQGLGWLWCTVLSERQ